jgi:hypothetical protein
MAEPIFPAFSEMFALALPDPPRGGISMVHAHFDLDPLPAFSAPITEHAYLKPKDGITMEGLKSLVGRMCSELAGPCNEYSTGATWATTEEHPNQLILLIGWKSHDVSFSLSPLYCPTLMHAHIVTPSGPSRVPFPRRIRT